MNDVSAAIFVNSFSRQLPHFESFILFGLVLYWVGASYRELMENWLSSVSGRITLVLALSFGAAYSTCMVREAGAESLLLASALGLGIALAFLDLNAAVGLAVSLLYLRPWELMPGNDYLLMLPKFTFVLCSIHAVLQLTSRKIYRPAWNSCATYILIFGFWAYLSTFKAGDPAQAQIAYFDTLFKSLVLFFVLLNTIWSRRNLSILVGTLLITFIAVGAISLSQTLGIAITSGERLRLIGIGAFRNSNDIAAIMVLVFPLSLMPLIRKHSHLTLKVLSLLLLLLVACCIWMSQSRGAMLGLGISLGLFLFLKMKSRWTGAGFLLAVLAVSFAFVHYTSRSAEDLSESSVSREIYIQAGISMALHNPVLGVGYDGYDGSFEHYASEIRYEWGNRTAHNSWVLVAAEEGIPALLLFVAAFFSAFREAWSLLDKAPEYLLSLIGYGVAITFLSHSYLFHLYLLYGLIGVAARVLTPSPRGERADFVPGRSRMVSAS